MNTGALAGLGIAAAIINVLSFLPYIRAILKGKTKPERSSWWIWSELMVIALAAQLAAGATWSALLTAVFLIGNTVVAFLSLRYGYGHFTAKDWLSVLAALAGVWLWKITNDPLAALLVTVAVDFIGNWLTILKSWHAPYTENLLTWALMGSAAVLSVLSVGELDVAKLLFPAYIIIANWSTFFVIIYRRRWRSQRIRAGIKRRRTTRPARH